MSFEDVLARIDAANPRSRAALTRGAQTL